MTKFSDLKRSRVVFYFSAELYGDTLITKAKAKQNRKVLTGGSGGYVEKMKAKKIPPVCKLWILRRQSPGDFREPVNQFETFFWIVIFVTERGIPDKNESISE